jgi:thioredoxin 1
MIPTQIYYDAAGKELYSRSGFIGNDDILDKWRELGYHCSR